jgi:hypothetical protein
VSALYFFNRSHSLGPYLGASYVYTHSHASTSLTPVAPDGPQPPPVTSEDRTNNNELRLFVLK